MTLLPVSAAHDYPSFEDHGGDQSRLDRVPVMVGIAMFFSSIGFGVPLPKVFYIQALLCPMIVAAAYLLSIREQRIGAVRINLAIAMMATWMVFSMGWTLAPSTRDAATTALLPITTSMTLALGISLFKPAAVMRFLAISTSMFVGAVILHAAASPGAAFSAGSGESEGIGLRSFYYTKNSLGQTLIYAVALRILIPKGRWRWLANVVLAALLVLTNNSGALIAAMGIVVVQKIASWVATEKSRGGRGGIFILSTVSAAFPIGALFGRNLVFKLVGRGSDLTGRDKIWKYTLQKALDEPWFGHGVGGFWNYSGGQAEYVRRSSGWAVTSGHQGFLDVLTDYGIIGLVIVVCIIGSTIVRIGRRVAAGDRGPVTILSVGITVGWLIGAISESTLIMPGLPLMTLVNSLMFICPVERTDVVSSDSFAETIVG